MLSQKLIVNDIMILYKNKENKNMVPKTRLLKNLKKYLTELRLISGLKGLKHFSWKLINESEKRNFDIYDIYSYLNKNNVFLSFKAIDIYYMFHLN